MNDGLISVLYFTNVLARGGAEEHILTLLRGLDRSRFRAGLVCPPAVAESMRPDLPEDVKLFPLNLRKPTQLREMRHLAEIIRKERVDILHAHQFMSSLCASPVGKLCGVPVTIETPHLREHWRTGWLKSRFFVDRTVGRFVDLYIAVSEANARYLAEQKGLPRKKIFVIRNGCDLTRFDPRHRAPAGFKERFGFDAGDRILVVLARLEPQKGHRVLLEAWPAVLREFPSARLACLGEGDLHAELESRGRTLGIADSVRFLGRQSNVEDWFAVAEATILPSFYEGLPLVAIESLAAGRPMVATSVDGTPEVIVNGKTGLTVPPGDPKALAAALCRMLRDPEARREMGQAGRQWVAQHFDQRAQIRETQDLYLSALENSVRQPKARRATQPVTASASAASSGVPVRSQALYEAICEETRQACVAEFGDALSGIILTGSLARNEGTFLAVNSGWRLLGDAEFLLILKDGQPEPRAAAINALSQGIEKRLRQRRLECPVCLAPAHADYLQQLKPHIFAYELRTCGRVVFGDPYLLSLIPEFGANEIPREDAWRLLCNRMIEMLEVVTALAARPESLPGDVFYRTVKLYLDMATSLLIFAGAYQPTYRLRAKTLQEFARTAGAGQAFPFDLSDFARRVAACTEWKLSGETDVGQRAVTGDNGHGFKFWEDAILYAHLLWRWELERMTGMRVQASDRELLGKWTGLQPAASRVRGWLYVARKQGWQRSWRDWPRWARHAWRASPRYCVYAAAGELFFRLPCLIQPEDRRPPNKADWEAMLSMLPMSTRRGSSKVYSWTELAAGIVANYQQFLVGTRS
jgi:glycosyltransferase involved in cell wall biosynthesis